MDMRSPVKKEKQSKNKDSDVVLTNLLSSDLDSNIYTLKTRESF